MANILFTKTTQPNVSAEAQLALYADTADSKFKYVDSEDNVTSFGDAVLNVTQQWEAAQIPKTRTASFEQPDFDTYQNFVFTLTSGTTHTLTNPTTATGNAGQTGVIVLIQPSSGTVASLAITASGDYRPVGGVAPSLTPTLSAVDVIPYMIQADNIVLLGAPQLDLKATS